MTVKATPIDPDLVTALAYCRLGGPRPERDASFREAKALGLLAQDPIWRTTAAGDGALVAAGLLPGHPEPDWTFCHILWARIADPSVTRHPQFVAAFCDGLVEAMPEEYERQRRAASRNYCDLVGSPADFFTTVERVARPPVSGSDTGP